MNGHRQECVTDLGPNNSELNERGSYHASAHKTICNDECATMEAYRAEWVMELAYNNSEPFKQGAPMQAHTKHFITMHSPDKKN